MSATVWSPTNATVTLREPIIELAHRVTSELMGETLTAMLDEMAEHQDWPVDPRIVMRAWAVSLTAGERLMELLVNLSYADVQLSEHLMCGRHDICHPELDLPGGRAEACDDMMTDAVIDATNDVLLLLASQIGDAQLAALDTTEPEA